MAPNIGPNEAEKILLELAASFLTTPADWHQFTEHNSQKGPEKLVGPDYEARYKILVEHIPGVIFIAPLNAASGEAYVSPQIEKILGFTREEWLGDPLRWYEQIHPEDKLRWSVEAASLFLSGEPLSSAYRVIARDGRVVWFQCDARMVHSRDGMPAFIHGVGFDVTALKETEASLNRARNELEVRVEERTRALLDLNAQLKEEIAEHKRTEARLIAAKEAAESAGRLKNEFMANISHEIRTPMNGILGLTNLVLSTELNADQRDYLSIAHGSAESLLGIINQILDFSRIESGKTQLIAAGFNLRNSTAALMAQLRLQATEKNVDLTYRISPEIPDFLVGDVGCLRQVLTNLINNAIKFTETGSISLEVLPVGPILPEDNTSCIVRFSITDTGIGISASKLDAIFEPFVQADGSITRDYGGTGLGLSISKELVLLMDGQMEVASRPQFGSTFSFTAKFGVASALAVQHLEESPRRPTGKPILPTALAGKTPLRILVAEDNLVNQKVVSRLMANHGHAVTVAQNGREALDMIGKASFDIVLMDVQMPLMDGLSATEAIRAIEAERGNSHLPIIGLTAHAHSADRARCLRSGMDAYLSKPYKPRELMSLIEELTKPHNED